MKRFWYYCSPLAFAGLVSACSGASSNPSIGPYSPTSSAVQVAPSSLTLTGTGSANAKTVIAGENFYTGTLSESDTCNPSGGTIAGISPTSGNSPIVFTVTPRAVGSCTITIADSNSQTATVLVKVVAGIGVSQSALTFSNAGASFAQTFSATEAGYNGSFSQTNTCSAGGSTTATVAPSSGSAPATFTVTPQGTGTCSITVADSNGQSAIVSVRVSVAIVVSPSSLNFLAVGSGFAQTFTATETGYNGTFSQTNTCNPSGGAIATVTPSTGSAPATFTVTAQAAGTCTITVSDANGQSSSVSVTVTTTSGTIQ